MTDGQVRALADMLIFLFDEGGPQAWAGNELGLAASLIELGVRVVRGEATDVAIDLDDAALRELARARGYELHSQAFSEAAQQALREIPEMRRRLDSLEAVLKIHRR